MGRRLTEAFKLLEKEYYKKARKEKWDKALPTFKNLNIDPQYKDTYNKLIISVTNLLDTKEKSCTTKINNIAPRGTNYIITNIKCPLCNKNIKINRHWNCYICQCPEHGKKVFEINKIIYPKPKQIIEIPDGYE